jgi:hypothetical protein
MKSESNLVMEIWEMFRDYVPHSRRTDTALGLLRAFEEYGFEADDLADVLDEDDSLTAAYRECFDIEDDEAEDDE